MFGGYLLDTDVISETAKENPTASVLDWLANLDELCLSTISIFELRRGIQRLREGRRRRFLDAWFQELLGSSIRILSFDQTCALAAAQLEYEARRQGRVIEVRDLFILSTARANGLRVATRNKTHFAGFGVVVDDPFVG
jgi:predicted nucleic acid-binding protein